MGVGPVALVASLIGLLSLAIRRPGEALLVASFPVAYLLFFLVTADLFFARFAIPLLPFIALLAGYGVVIVFQGVRRTTLRNASAVLAIALMVLPSLGLSARHDSLLRAEDTRLLLGRWVEANIPPGSKMAIEGYSFVDTRGRWLGPRKIPYQMEILPSLRTHPLDYYRREKFDYLIASSFAYGRYQLDPEARGDSLESYRRMEAELPLAAAFFPSSEGR